MLINGFTQGNKECGSDYILSLVAHLQILPTVQTQLSLTQMQRIKTHSHRSDSLAAHTMMETNLHSLILGEIEKHHVQSSDDRGQDSHSFSTVIAMTSMNTFLASPRCTTCK